MFDDEEDEDCCELCGASTEESPETLVEQEIISWRYFLPGLVAHTSGMILSCIGSACISISEKFTDTGAVEMDRQKVKSLEQNLMLFEEHESKK